MTPPNPQKPHRLVSELVADRLTARLLAKSRDQSRSDTAGPDRTGLILARDPSGIVVQIPDQTRLRHTHIVGSTGAGKSKLLEHAIRQDIIRGHGVCLLDPHGNAADGVYRSIIAWLAESGYLQKRVVHLLDVNATTHTTGFNPLARPDAATEPAVIASLMLEAVERVWGGEDMHSKPNIRRVLATTFKVLSEMGLTLAEARYLFDRDDRLGLRATALNVIQDEEARADLEELDVLARDARTAADYRMEVLGPINRLASFLSTPALKSIFGQTEHVLDLRKAMDEGHIILANLQSGDSAHDPETKLLGLLLTRFLFFHAKRRTYWRRPFFLYLDECQRYLSGEIDTILAEVRKNGIGVVLAHQWLRQLGETDDATRAAILNAPTTKIVFRANNAAEAEELALATIPLNLERVKHVLDKPTVVGHRLRILKGSALAETESRATMRAEMMGRAETDGSVSGTVTGEGMSAGSGEVMAPNATGGWFTPTQVLSESASAGSNNFKASSASDVSMSTSSWASSVGETKADSTARSQSEHEALEPVFETLPTTLYSKEEELYLAGQLLLGLPDRHFVAAYIGTTGRITRRLEVPPVHIKLLDEPEFLALRSRIFENSACAIPAGKARRTLEARKAAIAEHSRKSIEPESAAGFKHKRKRPRKSPEE